MLRDSLVHLGSVETRLEVFESQKKTFSKTISEFIFFSSKIAVTMMRDQLIVYYHLIV